MSVSALQLTGAALRYALDHIPAACWIEHAGQIRYANPALANLVSGGGPDTLIGRPSTHLLERQPGAIDVTPETIVAGLAPASGEEAVLRAAGERIPVQVTRSVVAFDGEVMLLSAFRVIRAEKDLRTALRESEERYRRLVDAGFFGLVEIDARRILSANDRFLAIIGRSREELKRGLLDWREISPEDGKSRDEEFGARLAGGDCVPIQKEFRRPDGSRVQVLMRCVQVTGQSEWRATCIVIDLTEHNRNQMRAADRLRSESVRVLAAGVAHTLNNQLTSIIGNAGLLREDPLLTANAGATRLLNEIIATGQDSAELASELLAYSGQGRFIMSPLDLHELIQTQTAHARVGLRRPVRFALELAERLPRVIGDPSQLRFLIGALVTNAIEAIGDREDGEVLVQTRIDEVAPGALMSRAGTPLPGGAYCVVRVRDNGAGMDANALSHAFDPFFTTKLQRLGLGLAAVAGIVNTAGGAIRVTTEVGKGSDVEVFLPPEKPDPSSGPPA
jgi:PAS domain S-box-containing protein